METLTLYGHPISSNTLKVMWLLEESGQPYAFRKIDLEKREQRSPTFLQLNPRGQVPVLKNGDFVLTESTAILRYICGKFGLTDLYPVGLEERALVDQWVDYSHNEVYALTHSLFVQKFIGPRLGRAFDPGKYQKTAQDLARHIRFMDQHLTGRHYLVAAWPTLADFEVAAHFAASESHGIDLGPYPVFANWLQSMLNRKSWRKIAK